MGLRLARVLIPTSARSLDSAKIGVLDRRLLYGSPPYTDLERVSLAQALRRAEAGLPSPRPAPSDCQSEPGYGFGPGEGSAILALRYPYLTAHFREPACQIEGPHAIEECPLWTGAVDSRRPLHPSGYPDV